MPSCRTWERTRKPVTGSWERLSQEVTGGAPAYGGKISNRGDYGGMTGNRPISVNIPFFIFPFSLSTSLHGIMESMSIFRPDKRIH